MRKRPRLFAAEVVQSSATDCGPACLTSLLEGHGISASYGRLREACHTDVDGSSIDTLEEIAVQLGLNARQVMVPVDHLLLREAALLPAIVVVRQPNGMTHFVVAWSVHAGFVQLMDPATGRRWSRPQEFLEEVYTHEMEIASNAWCEWAATDDFQGSLKRRLADLGLDREEIADRLAACSESSGWRAPAALDAATRAVASIVHDGGLRAGREARHAIARFFECAMDESAEPTAVIAAEFWTVRPKSAQVETLVLRGAVLISIAPGDPDPEEVRALPPDLAHALAEKRARPGRDLLKMLRADGMLGPGVLAALLALAAGGVLVEALLFRALFGIGNELAIAEQRLGGLTALVLFVALLLAIELPIARRTLALGRSLECRMRLRLLGKIARLHDRYFRSRLISDMAERSHRLHELRALPELGSEFLRSVFGIVLTSAGIIWLDPPSAVLVVAGAAACVAIPLLAQPLLSECDLRLRSHSGSLLRFHLDALLGIVPLRAHAAGRAVRREHENLLAEWARAGLRLQRRVVGVEALQSIVGFALAVILVFDHMSRDASGAGALLLVYWVLSLPVLGQQIGLCARQYPAQRSITLRFLELLGTPDEERTREPSSVEPPVRIDRAPGVAIRMEGVSVKAAGHTLLDGIDIEIAACSHVAIVGASGAGKSSLVGLLLGWHEPAQGRVIVDGELLGDRTRDELRRETAWVDPGVQLWNRSLLENLCYGVDKPSVHTFGKLIERSGVASMLDTLPDGLQSVLGEGGALVSGGEGQRVRLARATLRSGTRLAILDEPFRGLAREKRAELLEFARELWREATLLCVTHDIGETLVFDRVLVIEGGRIVEDGAPKDLASRESRYGALIEAAHAVRGGLESDSQWRRLRLERGRLFEVARGKSA